MISKRGRLVARGRSAHGGRPHEGLNAGAVLLDAVSELAGADDTRVKDKKVEPELRALRRLIGYETQGHSLGIAAHDEESGPLSVNLGTLTVGPNSVTCGLNIRYPVTKSWQRIGAALERTVGPFGFSTRVINHLEPLFVPSESPVVRSLLDSYATITGVTERPRSMPGGTYARLLQGRGVAFGAGFEGDDNRAHRPDEFVTIDALLRHGVISTHALFELGRLYADERYAEPR